MKNYELEKAKLTLEHLRKRYKRRVELRKINPNAISLEDVEDAEYHFHLQEIEVERLEDRA